jgi:hypothetical protein
MKDDGKLLAGIVEMEILPELDVADLKGYDLLCFCKPQRCHCDSILIKANT